MDWDTEQINEIKDHYYAFVNKGGIDSPGTIKQFEGSWMELDTHGNQESLSALKLVVIAKLDCVGKFGDFSEANSKISMRKGRYIQEIQNMHKGEYREYFAY